MDKDGAAYASVGSRNDGETKSFGELKDMGAAYASVKSMGNWDAKAFMKPEDGGADGSCGICPAVPVNVVDSTGAGDSFFSGVAAGLIHGLSLADACRIGTQMAAQVISKLENVYRENTD